MESDPATGRIVGQVKHGRCRVPVLVTYCNRELGDRTIRSLDDAPKWYAMAMIDTGASCSCVNRRLVETMGLLPRGVIRAGTLDGDAGKLPAYCVRIGLQVREGQRVMWAPAIVAEHSLEPEVCEVILGMDVLRHARFHLDGPAETFNIEF